MKELNYHIKTSANTNSIRTLGYIQNASAKIYSLTNLVIPIWTGTVNSTGKVVDSFDNSPYLSYGDYKVIIEKCDYDTESLDFRVPDASTVNLSVGCSSAITAHETTYNHTLINGGINSYFNLLKIYNANIFTETVSSSGLITSDLANGSIHLDIPTNNSTASLVEQSKSSLSGIPRMVMFRMGVLNFAGDSSSTYLLVGLSEGAIASPGQYVGVRIRPSGLTPTFHTNSTFTYVEGISISPGDILIIYATSTRCSLFINGIHQVTHTTTLPTNAIGHIIGLTPTIGFMGGGSNVTIDYMS